MARRSSAGWSTGPRQAPASWFQTSGLHAWFHGSAPLDHRSARDSRDVEHQRTQVVRSPSHGSLDNRRRMLRPSMLLVQFWDKEEIPGSIADGFASFETHNPGLDHRIFSQATAAEFIELNFTPREVAAFRACAVPSMQADYFRYCAILTLGGMYSDADFHCVGSLRTLEDEPVSGTLFVRSNGNVPCNFFAFRSAGHPFLKLALQIATARIERRDAMDDAWLATGPAITTYMYHLFGAGSIDAFLREFPGDEYTRDYPAFLAEVVGDYARVAKCFAGVRVLPFNEAKAWIRSTKPPYKQTDVHWTRWQGSIFR